MSDLKKWWWLGVVLTLSWLVYLLSPILTPFLVAATFAYLGDPMADWMMFLLTIRQDDPEYQQRLQAFYDGYGTFKSTRESRMRQQVYTAMHLGSAAIWSSQNGHESDIARAYRALDEIARSL